MVRSYMHYIIVAAAVAMFLGCSNGAVIRDSAMDRNWGRSFETALYQQILNPDAGKEPEPVYGMDGDAAVRNLEQYRKSFEKTDTRPVYNIEMSGLGITN